MLGADFGPAAWTAIMTAAWFTLTTTTSQAQEAGASAQPGAAQIALGDSIYQGRKANGPCWGCHGRNGKGTANAPKLTDSKWLDADGTLESIQRVITTGVPKPKKFNMAMPPRGGVGLTSEEIKAVAAYVYSLSHKGGKR